MNIAHVLSSFGMGGQERVALDLARGQKAAGCAVIAVSLADGPLARDFSEAGIATHLVPKHDGFDATLPLRLARIFRQFGVDVVHTHNPQPLIYGAPAAKLARARAVHTKHGANPDGGRRLWLRRAAARFCDAYVAVSPLTAEVAREKREVPERKLHTVPNGIDLSRFSPSTRAREQIRAELGIGAGAFVVGTVGRLAPEKAQTRLIDALAASLSEELQLVIVGDGSEIDRLRAARMALGAREKFVHLPGARRDVPAILAALDVFAMSSRTEGLPLVIPEAMASGLPVVSTAVGGIPGVVEEGVGFLVDDTAQLGARLLELSRDRGRTQAMGQRARNVALQKYSAQRMVDDYFAIYRRLLEGSRATPV